VDLIDNPKGEAVGEVVWIDVRNPADAALIIKAPELLAVARAALALLENPDADATDANAVEAQLRDVINQVVRA
jgi:hypothetical protein